MQVKAMGAANCWLYDETGETIGWPKELNDA